MINQIEYARSVLAIACVTLCLSCAYYSTSATGGSGIRSLAIPLMENESLESDIHQALTDSLIKAFVFDGQLRVVDEDRADAVLQGTIVEIQERPFTYGDEADQYEISVFLDVMFYDVRSKQVIWEQKRLRGYGVYNAQSQREEARSEGIAAAIRILTSDVVDRTQVGGW